MKLYSKLLLIAVVLFMTSCESVYHFVQVLKTEPTSNSLIQKVNGGMLYEDESCAIFYTFWSEGGDASFEFYNRSNNIIYVDLEKSFLIVNGIAHNYYGNRTWIETKTSSVQSSTTYLAGETVGTTRAASISQYYAGNFGKLPLSNYSPVASSASASTSLSSAVSVSAAQSNAVAYGKTSGIETREANIIAIPPHASKFIGNYDLVSRIIVDCDLELYPSDSATLLYNKENSPLVFSNYITYKIGENETLQTIENEFYVATITNYARPSIITYKERPKFCNNVLPMSQRYINSYKVYDAYVTIPTAGAFYFTYKTSTHKKLYKLTYPNYYWNSTYQGYVVSQ